MSVGPMPSVLAAAVASSPLAQTSGSELERAAQETSAQDRRTQANTKADAAAGVGQTNGEDHQSEERDADGRRPWELPATGPKKPEDEKSSAEDRRAKDATGQCGHLLDLTG